MSLLWPFPSFIVRGNKLPVSVTAKGTTHTNYNKKVVSDSPASRAAKGGQRRIAVGK